MVCVRLAIPAVTERGTPLHLSSVPRTASQTLREGSPGLAPFRHSPEGVVQTALLVHAKYLPSAANFAVGIEESRAVSHAHLRVWLLSDKGRAPPPLCNDGLPACML